MRRLLLVNTVIRFHTKGHSVRGVCTLYTLAPPEGPHGRTHRSQHLRRRRRRAGRPDARESDGRRLGTTRGGVRRHQTFRERVLHETTGEGTTGIDDRYATAYFDEVGAEIMGAGMFGPHAFPEDPHWRGWWGEEPPFRGPVLVLTHRERPAIDFANGTRFEFLAAAPEAALARAREHAGGGDIRIGGGASVARDFLRAGLVDRVHVAITPIVLGRGVRLWGDLHARERDYTVVRGGRQKRRAGADTWAVAFTRESCRCRERRLTALPEAARPV